MKPLIPIVDIHNKIYSVRGMRVMIDVDLARLYGVTTKQLNQQVKRNLDRFPDDFMVRLTIEESQSAIYSRSQSVTLKQGSNVKYSHTAFTEQGISMLSSVLRSERAAQVNIMIMRAFVQLRSLLSTHKDLAKKLEELELKLRKHDVRFKKNAQQIKLVFQAIYQLMDQKTTIGFKPSNS